MRRIMLYSMEMSTSIHNIMETLTHRIDTCHPKNTVSDGLEAMEGYLLFIRMALVFTFPWKIEALPPTNVQWYQQPEEAKQRRGQLL